MEKDNKLLDFIIKYILYYINFIFLILNHSQDKILN